MLNVRTAPCAPAAALFGARSDGAAYATPARPAISPLFVRDFARQFARVH